MSNPVSSIALAIGKGCEYLTLLLKTSRVRKMVKTIKFATNYIELTEEIEKTDNPKEIKKLKTRRRYSKKKFRHFKSY